MTTRENGGSRHLLKLYQLLQPLVKTEEIKNIIEDLEKDAKIPSDDVRVPVVECTESGYGNVDDIKNVKLSNLPTFTGTNKPDENPKAWIQKLINTAETHKLTARATIDLLCQKADSNAWSEISRWRKQNLTLPQIVNEFESRFLPYRITPALAKQKVSILQRMPKESLDQYASRLSDLVEIAVANSPSDVRNEQREQLLIHNFERVLSTDISRQLSEKKKQRRLYGDRPFTFLEMKAEANMLEIEEIQRRQFARQTLRLVNDDPAYDFLHNNPPKVNVLHDEDLRPTRLRDTLQDQVLEIPMPYNDLHLVPTRQKPNVFSPETAQAMMEKDYKERLEKYNREKARLATGRKVRQKVLLVTEENDQIMDVTPLQTYENDQYSDESYDNGDLAHPGYINTLYRPQNQPQRRNDYPPRNYGSYNNNRPNPQYAQRDQRYGNYNAQQARSANYSNRLNPRPNYYSDRNNNIQQTPAPNTPTYSREQMKLLMELAKKSGPPAPLRDRNQSFPSNLLPILANVEPQECLKCGMEGHSSNEQSCALYDKPLMDKACNYCSKGLHSSQYCIAAAIDKHSADAKVETSKN